MAAAGGKSLDTRFTTQQQQTKPCQNSMNGQARTKEVLGPGIFFSSFSSLEAFSFFSFGAAAGLSFFTCGAAALAVAALSSKGSLSSVDRAAHASFSSCGREQKRRRRQQHHAREEPAAMLKEAQRSWQSRHSRTSSTRLAEVLLRDLRLVSLQLLALRFREDRLRNAAQKAFRLQGERRLQRGEQEGNGKCQVGERTNAVLVLAFFSAGAASSAAAGASSPSSAAVVAAAGFALAAGLLPALPAGFVGAAGASAVAVLALSGTLKLFCGGSGRRKRLSAQTRLRLSSDSSSSHRLLHGLRWRRSDDSRLLSSRCRFLLQERG